MFNNVFKKYDLVLLFLAILMTFLGMITYYPFIGNSQFFFKQSVSLTIAIIVYFIFSNIDIKLFKKQKFINLIYYLVLFLLVLLFIIGSTFSGASSWVSLGFFAFQPTDLAKIVMVLFLARYFSKKHLEINKMRHLFISAFYMFLYFFLILIQPDLGSALILFGIWFFMILILGVSKKYVFFFLFFGVLASLFMYNFVLKDYQKKRVDVFLNPKSDILHYGYNIHQANIALGSGQIFGKGVGEGSQNHLEFLPESETDFIFSSFAEEWGFVGVLFYILIFTFFAFRILRISYLARNNFESILALGLLVYYTVHFIFHLAINLNIFPVTGITLSFLSYGGSHLLIEFLGLGIINKIRENSLKFNRNDIGHQGFEIK